MFDAKQSDIDVIQPFATFDSEISEKKKHENTGDLAPRGGQKIFIMVWSHVQSYKINAAIK